MNTTKPFKHAEYNGHVELSAELESKAYRSRLLNELNGYLAEVKQKDNVKGFRQVLEHVIVNHSSL